MAFNQTTLAPTLVQAIGSFTSVAVGVATLSGGTVAVTIPQLKNVQGAGAFSNSSTNATYVSATAGNQITITGNGSDQVFWIAFGTPYV